MLCLKFTFLSCMPTKASRSFAHPQVLLDAKLDGGGYYFYCYSLVKTFWLGSTCAASGSIQNRDLLRRDKTEMKDQGLPKSQQHLNTRPFSFSLDH